MEEFQINGDALTGDTNQQICGWLDEEKIKWNTGNYWYRKGSSFISIDKFLVSLLLQSNFIFLALLTYILFRVESTLSTSVSRHYYRKPQKIGKYRPGKE